MATEPAPVLINAVELLHSFCEVSNGERAYRMLAGLDLGEITIKSRGVLFTTDYFHYDLSVTFTGDVRVYGSTCDEPQQYTLFVLNSEYTGINALLGDAVHRIRTHLHQNDPRYKRNPVL